jgi:hypothetical protein
MWKRLIAVALSGALMLGAFSGCGEKATVFEGTVLDHVGESLLVREDSGGKDSFSLSGVELTDGEGNSAASEDFTPGSRVEVTYTGDMRLSDPAGIDASKVKLLSQGVSFRGTVLEQYENGKSILVEADEDASVRNSSDQFTMGLSEAVLKSGEGETLEAADFLPGSRVEISFDGYIRESYPAQIDAAQIILLEGPETGSEIQIPNPMVEYDTPDFTQKAGFAISALPQVDDMTLEGCWLIDGRIAQLDYNLEVSTELCFRVAVDTGEDISGVYKDDWEEDATYDLEGVPVRQRASAGGPALVTWSKDGYAFSMYFPHPQMGMAGGLTPTFLEGVEMSPELAPGYTPVRF